MKRATLGYLLMASMILAGCSAGGKWVEEESPATGLEYFCAQAWHPLKVDIARGQGAYLETLAFELGCDGRAASEFGPLLKLRFGLLYPSPERDVTRFVRGLASIQSSAPDRFPGCRSIGVTN